jgi:hypothetical protein
MKTMPTLRKKTLPELAVVLPAMPKSENLLEFQASAASTSHYFIDAPSISIEKDGTVRYTLVVKGSGGGENISYEAIRCDTLEQKAFAFGRRNGTWANAKESAWRKIQYKTGNLQYAVLYTDYFCPDGKPIRSPKDAIAAFKYGVPYGQPPPHKELTLSSQRATYNRIRLSRWISSASST